MGIDRRKYDRLGAVYAIIAANRDRRDVLDLSGAPMKARDFIAARAVNDVVIERIGRNIAVLDRSDRMPVTEGDLAVIAASRGTN